MIVKSIEGSNYISNDFDGVIACAYVVWFILIECMQIFDGETIETNIVDKHNKKKCDRIPSETEGNDNRGLSDGRHNIIFHFAKHFTNGFDLF